MGSTKEQSKPQLRPIADSKGNPLVQSDQNLVNEIKDDHQATIDYVNTAVGKTTAPINSYFSLVQDDPSVQLVTNAQKWYVEEEFKNQSTKNIKEFQFYLRVHHLKQVAETVLHIIRTFQLER